MRLAGVSKRYGRAGRWVLTDVDLELPGGASIAIHGTNGSGKSTLLRMIAGLSRPTRGMITGAPPVVGYVPDRFPAVDRMSPVAYLTHLGRIRGLVSTEARRRGLYWLDRFALVGDAAGPMRALSKGNAQKVALAQALLVPPDLLVLDEPWSGLDAGAHAVLRRIVDEVTDGGGTVVFADHGESRATYSYAVDDGRVTPLRTEPFVEVVLRGDRPIDWAGVPGVVRAGRASHGVRLAVRPDACDQVLRQALSNGWSVVEVRPWVP